LTTILLMTGAAGGLLFGADGTVTWSGFETALVPAEVVSVAVNVYAPAGKSAVVKVHTKALFAVVVPSGFAPPSDTVTVEPPGAVPVKVTEWLELTTP